MKPIKKIFPLLIAAVMAFLLPTPLQASGDDTIHVVIEEPHEPVPSFAFLSFEFSGQQEIVDKASLVSQKDSQLGFNLGFFTAVQEDVRVEGIFGYRRLNAEQIGYGLENISDFSFHFGGRYYPNNPTFSLGKIPIRLTFSALGGINWLTAGPVQSVFPFSALLSAGLSISSRSSRSGLLIEFVYRPISMDMKLMDESSVLMGTLLIKSSWCISIAWLFAPAPE